MPDGCVGIACDETTTVAHPPGDRMGRGSDVGSQVLSSPYALSGYRGGVAKTVHIRMYTVQPGRLDEWVELFRTRIAPVRRQLGFEIDGSWVDREHGQHIWVLAYSGPLTFEQANAEYWASPQRAALGVDPKEFLLWEEIREVSESL